MTSRHVYLCTTCGARTGRMLGKGACNVCRNKTLKIYPHDEDPEFIKKFRAIHKLNDPTTPMQCNILVTVLLCVAVGVTGTYFHFQKEIDKAKTVALSTPIAQKVLSSVGLSTGSGQVATGSNTTH